MKYQVDFKPSAARELRKLPKDIAKRISEKIDSLGSVDIRKIFLKVP